MKKTRMFCMVSALAILGALTGRSNAQGLTWVDAHSGANGSSQVEVPACEDQDAQSEIWIDRMEGHNLALLVDNAEVNNGCGDNASASVVSAGIVSPSGASAVSFYNASTKGDESRVSSGQISSAGSGSYVAHAGFWTKWGLPDTHALVLYGTYVVAPGDGPSGFAGIAAAIAGSTRCVNLHSSLTSTTGTVVDELNGTITEFNTSDTSALSGSFSVIIGIGEEIDLTAYANAQIPGEGKETVQADISATAKIVELSTLPPLRTVYIED